MAVTAEDKQDRNPGSALRIQPLSINATAVGNVGTGVDDLMTYSMPGGTLATNADAVRITGYGQFAANANNKEFQLLFGATAIIDVGGLGPLSGATFYFEAMVIRTGATSQISWARLDIQGVAIDQYQASPAETLANAITIKGTGETDAASNDDVAMKLMLIERVYTA